MPHPDVLDTSPLFHGIDRQTMSAISASLIAESWSKGRQIAGPTDSVECFRLVIAGRVKVVRSRPTDGQEVTLWLLGPGDGFDIVSLLDGRPHATSAWALDDVRTLSAPMSQWRDWLDHYRPLQLAAHRYIADKLREITELASDLALHDTSTRLAHLLLRHFQTKGSNLLRDLPQRELASMIGSVRIVVSRVLAQMRRQGIVELHGGAVRAVDLKRLLHSAEAEFAPTRTETREPRMRKR